MSDFLYARSIIPQENIERGFKQVYDEEFSEIFCFFSNNNTFAILKNIYNGYQIYKIDNYVCAVIGGPLLRFRDNNFITSDNCNDGTKAIYNRWVVEDKIKWDEDIDGPYVVLLFNTVTGDIKVVTDMLSFIPVFSSNCGTIASSLGIIDSIENCELDDVSFADFFINDVITFPYTALKNVFQIYPASVHSFSVKNSIGEHTYNNYWLPKEVSDNESNDLLSLTIRLRKGFKSYIDRIVESNPQIGVLISGGEDSRAVIGAIPKNYPKNCFIYSQNDNVEIAIAQKVAMKNGSSLTTKYINKDYIIEVFEKAANLVGVGADCAHVHSYGFHKTLDFAKYDVILGGFLADSFVKALYIPKKSIKRTAKEKSSPQLDDWSFTNRAIGKLVDSSIVAEVNIRRSDYNKMLMSIRPVTFVEWSGLFPISMNKHHPNICGNRRLFRNYEPFTCSEVIKTAAISSQKIKQHRILFQKAMKPFFKSTKWIIHNKGHFPYLPYSINKYVVFLYRVVKKIRYRKSGIATWFDWSYFFNSDEGKKKYNDFYPLLQKTFPKIFGRISENVFNKNLSDSQKRNVLQLGYFLKRRVK